MFEKIIEKLSNSQDILIIFHESPDGDAIASSLALGIALEKKDKNVSYVCHDTIPEVFNFLPHIDKVKNNFILGDYDLICTVDCGDARRTGFPERIKQFTARGGTVINIDHHCRNDLHKIATLNLTNERAAASAELVYRIIQALEINIDRTLATLLLTGLYTDTGGFQHSNTTPKVYSLASRLLARGAPLGRISKKIILNKSLPALKIWGLAMARVRKHANGLVTSYITQGDIKTVNASVDDLAGAVNIINTIPDSSASILFAELPDDKIRASLRTEKNNVDVAQLARFFGGGGHRKASGFQLDGKIIEFANGGWTIDMV